MTMLLDCWFRFPVIFGEDSFRFHALFRGSYYVFKLYVCMYIYLVCSAVYTITASHKAFVQCVTPIYLKFCII